MFRFYSKFHRRKLLELTEMGLANFNSLFLVLASIGDTQDVVRQLFATADIHLTSVFIRAKR